MKEIFQDKRLWRFVLAPSVIWVLFWSFYIVKTLGLENLAEYLPSELSVLILGLILPVILFSVWFILISGQAQSAAMVDEIQRQGEQIELISKNLDGVSELVYDSARLTTKDIDTLLQASTELVSFKSSYHTDIDTLSVKIEQIRETSEQSKLSGMESLQSINAIPENLTRKIESNDNKIDVLSSKLDNIRRLQEDRAGQINFEEVRQQTALLGLVNFVLNDINVSSSRILVRLMENEERPNGEIREFIQGLSNAFSMGDRNVFVMVLQHQLAGSQARLESLQLMAREYPEVAADILKIIQVTNEVFSMVDQFKEDSMIAAIFKDMPLKALGDILSPHFTRVTESSTDYDSADTEAPST